MMRIQTIFSLFEAAVLCVGAAIAVSAAGGKPAAPTADPAAYALLKEAHDNRSTFPAGFSGLNADLILNDNGKELQGTLTYTSSGDLHLTLNGATKEEQEWARDQIGSALSHRRPDDFAHGDGSNPITFVQDDHSPLGRQVALNDALKSFYRVRDKQIIEVTRTMGDMRFTITVLENRTVDGGKYLPAQFVVTYFDSGTGSIKQVEEYTDGYARVGGAWVPSSRRVITAEHGDFTTRTISLNHVRLLGATTAVKTRGS